MARDPLATLAKLRRLDIEAGQRRLVASRAALASAQEAAAMTQQALSAERPDDAPGTYGAFLARLLATRHLQAAALARAEAAVETERDSLAMARGAEKLLDILRARRAAAARRHAARRSQARMEESTAASSASGG